MAKKQSKAIDKKAQNEFLNSAKWIIIKNKLFEKRGRKCEICGATKKIQVHHLNYKRYGGDEKLSDLKILCPKHHMMAHKIIEKDVDFRKRMYGKSKNKKKNNDQYKDILTIYPKIMKLKITKMSKALKLKEAFNSNVKLEANSGDLNPKKCRKYIRKIKIIYDRENDLRKPIDNQIDQIKIYDAPCWHYSNEKEDVDNCNTLAKLAYKNKREWVENKIMGYQNKHFLIK